uniref:Uncharacterized protein n=1 Tax=Lepeophtheirus salmonis TaxID=72036 RepID=A0A0K2V6M7_LEPSM
MDEEALDVAEEQDKDRLTEELDLGMEPDSSPSAAGITSGALILSVLLHGDYLGKKTQHSLRLSSNQE